MRQFRKPAITFIVMVMALMATSLSFANEFGPAGTGIPDDPTDDNSCYPGGQWEGLCSNDYQWNAGWYHIRFIYGEITLEQVPDAYKLWMPQPGQVEPGSSSSIADSDGDGIPDSEDFCPSIPGLIMYEGCPPMVPIDSDGDGLTDMEDICPGVFGFVLYGGCPDSDSDGVPENGNDWCPGQAGTAVNHGCPDSDGDGFYDDIDMCTDIYSTTNFGCPADDSDFDGIPDPIDACPFQPAPPGDLDGCADEL
jgi:hypothetical protein